VKDWHVYSQSDEIGECTVFWKLEKKDLPSLKEEDKGLPYWHEF